MSYYTWAPVFNCYGSNNRTNSVRVPMGGGRCESATPTAPAIPIWPPRWCWPPAWRASARDSIPARRTRTTSTNSAERTRRARHSILPQTLQEAVEAFAADPFVEEALGNELRDEFITYKSEEWGQYHQRVSQWEIDKYARLF